jgi:dipeptidase E
MKYYLSSYKLGNQENVEILKSLIAPTNNKCAYIPNALDFASDLDRKNMSNQSDIDDLESIGLAVEILDLKKYFGKKSELERKLDDFDVIWVRGGNVFNLRQAYQLSGFDEVLLYYHKSNTSKIYGAYSAGVCVLCPTLKYYAIVDDPSLQTYGEGTNTIWDGLGILDYVVEPHYKSDHPESHLVDKEIEELIESGVGYVALRDGEVIIINLNFACLYIRRQVRRQEF